MTLAKWGNLCGKGLLRRCGCAQGNSLSSDDASLSINSISNALTDAKPRAFSCKFRAFFKFRALGLAYLKQQLLHAFHPYKGEGCRAPWLVTWSLASVFPEMRHSQPL